MGKHQGHFLGEKPRWYRGKTCADSWRRNNHRRHHYIGSTGDWEVRSCKDFGVVARPGSTLVQGRFLEKAIKGADGETCWGVAEEDWLAFQIAKTCTTTFVIDSHNNNKQYETNEKGPPKPRAKVEQKTRIAIKFTKRNMTNKTINMFIFFLS